MRVLYHLARADFLERVRRYYFLITLVCMIYFAYLCAPPNYHRYVTMEMSGHRPIFNSAFTASLTAILTSIFLSLAGFYLVKNAIDRDLQTGVGQILAATRMSTWAYMLGKALSNFAVLTAMVAVMPVLAGVMQLVRGEDATIQIDKLLAPFLFIVLPVMAIVASMGVLFEAIPFLRRGLGNVVYFFVWIISLAMFASHSDSGLHSSGNDLIGVAAIVPGIRAGCEAAFPGCGAGKEFNLGFNFKEHGVWTLTNFRWEGVHWTAHILFWRAALVAISIGLCLLAATFFSRFDPASNSIKRPKKKAPRASAASASLAMAHASFARLPLATVKFNFLTMVRAELGLALKGVSRWWYGVALGLMVGEVASPLSISRYWLMAAWIWPLIIWSAIGTREARQGTAQLVFSTAHPLRRQLPACWMAGVIVSMATGSGAAIRLLVAGNRHELLAWAVGAFFIPTLALTLGVWSGSSKLFEILYLLLWYIGPVNHVSPLDYMGASEDALSGTTLRFLTATLVLAAFAIVGRKRQIQI